MTSSIASSAFRRRITATSLIVGPAALVIASAAKVVASTDPHETLAAVAAHPTREVVSDLGQLLAVLLLVPGTVGILRMFRGRGAALGVSAVVLIFVNALGNIGDVMRGGLLTALAHDGVTAGDLSVLRDVDGTAAASAIEVMVAVGLLGFPLLAAALWRARTVPRWVPAILVAGVVSFFFPVNEGIGSAVMWVGFATIGLQLARSPEPDLTASDRVPAALAS